MDGPSDIEKADGYESSDDNSSEFLDDRSQPAHNVLATNTGDNLSSAQSVAQVSETSQISRPEEVFTTRNAQKVSFAVGDMVVVAGGQKKFDFAQIDRAEKHPLYGYTLRVTYHEKNQENQLMPMNNPMYKKSSKPWVNNIKMDSIIKNLKGQTAISEEIEQGILALLMDIFSSDEDD